MSIKAFLVPARLGVLWLRCTPVLWLRCTPAHPLAQHPHTFTAGRCTSHGSTHDLGAPLGLPAAPVGQHQACCVPPTCCFGLSVQIFFLCEPPVQCAPQAFCNGCVGEKCMHADWKTVHTSARFVPRWWVWHPTFIKTCHVCSSQQPLLHLSHFTDNRHSNPTLFDTQVGKLFKPSSV